MTSTEPREEPPYETTNRDDQHAYRVWYRGAAFTGDAKPWKCGMLFDHLIDALHKIAECQLAGETVWLQTPTGCAEYKPIDRLAVHGYRPCVHREAKPRV